MLHILPNAEPNKIKLPCSYSVFYRENSALISNSLGHTVCPLGKGVEFQAS